MKISNQAATRRPTYKTNSPQVQSRENRDNVTLGGDDQLNAERALAAAAALVTGIAIGAATSNLSGTAATVAAAASGAAVGGATLGVAGIFLGGAFLPSGDGFGLDGVANGMLVGAGVGAVGGAVAGALLGPGPGNALGYLAGGLLGAGAVAYAKA